MVGVSDIVPTEFSEIVAVSQSYPPVSRGIAVTTWRWANAMTSAGWRLTLITENRPEMTSDWWSNSNIRVIAIPSTPRFLPRRIAGNLGRLMLGTYWASWWALKACRVAEEVLRNKEKAVLVTRTEPGSGIVVGERLARTIGFPWVAAINDPHPICFYPPPCGKGRATTRVEHRHVRYVTRAISKASALVIPCERMARWQLARTPVPSGIQAVAIPHCSIEPDDRPVEPVGGITIRHTGSLTYVGSTVERFLEILAGVVDQLPDRNQIRMQFVGSLQAGLGELIARYHLSDICSLFPQVSAEDSVRLQRESHALLLLESPMSEGVLLSAKVSDYASSGRPVLMLSPEVGTIADLVGGSAHPGFLTSDDGEAARRLRRFIFQASEGRSCEPYRLPCARGMLPKDHAEMWIETLRNVASFLGS